MSRASRRTMLQSALAGSSILAVQAVANSSPTMKDCKEAATIDGHCPDRFAGVRDAFQRNFEDLGELGADVSVYIEGREVLHLWGGFADYGRSKRWMRDTLVIPASAIKGLFPFCVHKLVDDGVVAYDDPVGRYWPEFSTAGKEKTTIRHLLSHWAGLETTFPIDVYSHPLDELFPIMEAARPTSPPGTKGAYHSQTYMPLIAGLVFKITGMHIRDYFRREIAAPWGIDAWFRLTPSEAIRGADYVVPVGSPYHSMLIEGGMIEGKEGEDMVTPPSAFVDKYLSPFVNARGFARLYGAVAKGGELDGVRLFSASTCEAMGTRQWLEPGIESHSNSGGNLMGTMGWMQAGGAFTMGPNTNTFGMPGAGGNMGLADPDAKMGFGYCLNSWHTFGQGLGPRLNGLLNAVYAAL